MLNIALLGNPNVGKTTVFNLLTGSNQYVGNWPGVTIEKKEGFLEDDIKIVDLPGIYAMDTFSNEEKVSKSFLEKEDVDLILNVVDASNLTRNLYLTTQLMQFNKPIVILLNMLDVAKARGMEIDTYKLAREFGVTVIPIVAKKKEGVDDIASKLREAARKPFIYSTNWGNEEETFPIEDEKTIRDKIDSIVLHPIFAYPIFIGLLLLLFKFTFDWVGGPLQEGFAGLIENYIAAPADAAIVILLNMLDVAKARGMEIDTHKLAREFGVTVIPIVAKKKEGVDDIASKLREAARKPFIYSTNWGNEEETYKIIEEKLALCTNFPKEDKKTISDKIDSIVLHPIFAYPIFIGLLLLLFFYYFFSNLHLTGLEGHFKKDLRDLLKTTSQLQLMPHLQALALGLNL